MVLISLPQTVLITGGSDGMGRAVAGLLAGKGAHVVVVARTASKLQATVEELKVRISAFRSRLFNPNWLTPFPVQGVEHAEAAIPLHCCRPH